MIDNESAFYASHPAGQRPINIFRKFFRKLVNKMQGNENQRFNRYSLQT